MDISSLSNTDFIHEMQSVAHPEDNPSAEHADFMDEAVVRICILENALSNLALQSECGYTGGASRLMFSWIEKSREEFYANRK